MHPHFQQDNIYLYHGDCLDVLATLPKASVDFVVTDPPYGFKFMGKDWDHEVPGPKYWQAIARVCKPGALLMAFGGARTYHRLACAIEDAGWEIRDCLMWLYGTGFPKSLDISKAIDKSSGAAREIIGVRNSTYDGAHRDPSKHKSPAELSNIGDWGLTKTPHGLPLTAPATNLAKRWDGWGTALKPAWEPILLAMKPLESTFAANAEKHGVAGMNIDACRIPCKGGSPSQQRRQGTVPVGNYNGWNVPSRNGYNDPRPGETLGRWPANLLLDEDAARLLDTQTGTLKSGTNCVRTKPSSGYHGRIGKAGDVQVTYGDSGGASRFFYCSKASKKERGPGNDHPCVKPIDLMEYLLTLLSTPDGGLVLDPFAGSGSTLVAAKRLQRPCIGVELDKHNCEIAQARISEA